MKIDTPGLGTYPCFSRKGLAERSLLLHVTTVCNTRCRHCVRAEGPAGGEQRMGIGTTAMDADAAVQLVDRGLKRPEPPVVVEIGGPGEPLLNRSTYAVLRRLRAEYPGLERSESTNGSFFAARTMRGRRRRGSFSSSSGRGSNRQWRRDSASPYVSR
jgi:nitrogen fixation protein NifB